MNQEERNKCSTHIISLITRRELRCSNYTSSIRWNASSSNISMSKLKTTQDAYWFNVKHSWLFTWTFVYHLQKPDFYHAFWHGLTRLLSANHISTEPQNNLGCNISKGLFPYFLNCVIHSIQDIMASSFISLISYVVCCFVCLCDWYVMVYSVATSTLSLLCYHWRYRVYGTVSEHVSTRILLRWVVCILISADIFTP